jgi:hypothetical protein
MKYQPRGMQIHWPPQGKMNENDRPELAYPNSWKKKKKKKKNILKL